MAKDKDIGYSKVVLIVVMPALFILCLGSIPTIHHDTLDGFVADEHIDHTAVSISAGYGLSGGGEISTTRTLAFDSTEIDATTWSDGTNASNIWTFDVSGTDHTMTAGSGLMTFSNNVTVGGTTFTVGDGTGAAGSITWDTSGTNGVLTYAAATEKLTFSHILSAQQAVFGQMTFGATDLLASSSGQFDFSGDNIANAGSITGTTIEGTGADFDTLQIDGSGSTGITLDNYKKIQMDAADTSVGAEFFVYTDDNLFIDTEESGSNLYIRPENTIVAGFNATDIRFGTGSTYPASWSNYVKITAAGVMTFHGTGALIIPSGTEPSPDTLGALFLDTNAGGGDGSLMMYTVSGWKTVKDFN